MIAKVSNWYVVLIYRNQKFIMIEKCSCKRESPSPNHARAGNLVKLLLDYINIFVKHHLDYNGFEILLLAVT